MKIRETNFDFENHGYIMGILNMTPDSFSDGGRYNNMEKGINHAKKMINEGAEIIDIGGESTRPGHVEISWEEESKRILPIIKEIRNFSDITLSIDTFNYKTFEKAYKEGGDILNDINGLKDKNMGLLAKDLSCPVIIMHNVEYVSFDNFLHEIDKMIERSLSYGIDEDKLIIDPGIGFKKDTNNNLEILRNFERLKEFSFPILLGTSKKRFLGRVLKEEDTDERTEGTVATTVLGYEKGARIFRVHDVKENYRAMKVSEAIINGIY